MGGPTKKDLLAKLDAGRQRETALKARMDSLQLIVEDRLNRIETLGSLLSKRDAERQELGEVTKQHVYKILNRIAEQLPGDQRVIMQLSLGFLDGEHFHPCLTDCLDEALRGKVEKPVPVAVEEDLWDVHLMHIGERKIATIKAVREITSLGLKEAKNLVESSLPQPVRCGMPRGEALRAKTAIDSMGGEARIVASAL